MIIIYLQMGGGKIKGIKWLFYFSFLLKMITFAVYFYPLLHRDGTVQILQNLLVRIIYHGIVLIYATPQLGYRRTQPRRTDCCHQCGDGTQQRKDYAYLLGFFGQCRDR